MLTRTKFWNKKFLAGGLFIIALLVLASIYNYQELVFYKPQSIHKWRQSDCASITLNYYQGGMHFFKPEVHNLTSKGGTSGLAYTSELPLYYYSVAFLYRMVGANDAIYRFLNTLIFLLGLYYLHRLFLLITNDVAWSIIIPLIFFTSPVLVYYGNNFLTNSSELSFSIIGWFYFVKYCIERKSKWFFISLLIFFFAASFKITAFISLFSIGAILFLEFIGLFNFSNGERLFKKPGQYFWLMVLIVAIIASWVAFASIQNTKNGCTYFSTVTFPIWDLDKQGIQEVLTKIRTVWLNQYFNVSVLIFFSIEFLFVVIHFKKLPLLAKWILPIILFEIKVFVLLQFWTFSDHDYYTIGLYIFPILLSLTTFYLLKKHYNKFFESSLTKLSLVFLLVFNIYYAKGELYNRYHSWWNDFEQNKDLYSIEPYLRQLGIHPMDTVISIPDFSHASLYLMNQKGWTNYTEANFNKGDRYKYNADSMGIAKSKSHGADYLILNGIENLYEKDYLQSFSYKLIGRHKNVFIFDLNAIDTNFTLSNKKVKKVYFCDAERLSEDGKFYLCDDNQFEYGNTKTNKEVFAGESACALDEKNPYGMTMKLKELDFGESFKLNVWRKSNTATNAGIVVSIGNQVFYECNTVDSAFNGWQKIESRIFIRENFVGNELVLYLYNPSKEPVYFDNFEITRYQSILD